MIKDRTWYVLKDSIPASSVDQLLGSLVQDFRDPTAGFLPSNAKPRELVPGIANLVETHDLDARVEVNKVRSTALSTQLFEILTGSHIRSREASLVLESLSIHTRRLVNHAQLFADLIVQPPVKTGLEALWKSSGKRNLFFVVGVKTCSHSTLSATNGRTRENEVGVALPLDAVIGSPGLIPGATVGASVSVSNGVTTVMSLKREDERIFALEYRIVRRDWFGFGNQSRLSDKLDDTDGGHFFGPEDSDAESDDAEDEDDDDLAETLGLVDATHTLNYLVGTGTQVDERSGYAFS
jgi:hypothetical protein